MIPVLIAVGCLSALVLGAILRRNYQFRTRGYLVSRHGRDQVEYRERSRDGVRSLVIGGDLLKTGRLIYIPTREQWDETMPSWARGRRDEIVDRVKATLTEGYEFQESPVA